MRVLALVLIGTLSYLFVPAQTIKRCATFESMKEFRALHPDAETDAQFEAWLSQKIHERQQSGQRVETYFVVPIIFHIVYDGEAVGTGRNLSAATIQQQLNQLNQDYANLSGSAYGVSADMQIQFCLATVNPIGGSLTEPGIDRVDRNAKGWNAPPYAGTATNSYVDVTIMPGSIWDPHKYFNVWTLDLSGGLLGKATFPLSSGLPGLSSGETDTHAGVFMHYQSVGSVCSPGPYGTQYGLGRTLTHESGHFFGLRHITGDATCGDDFCADTPPQDALTSGCPGTGTLNNCTPSGPKMFENYMDYTDDACVNTFTADQKTRMQTVMTNSPRRMDLPGAGSCTGSPANSIRFNYICAQVSETGTVSTCPRYRDVLVNVNVFSAANNNATVTFTKGGTATDNVDYTITPSSLSYINGDNLPKTVTIRIWDDAVVESTETLVLGYTISGSGVVAGSSNQTFTLTITDNDVTPVIDNNGVTAILNQNFESGSTGWTSGSFLATPGANVWTVSGNGGTGITGNSAHITNNTGTNVLNYDNTSSSDVILISPFINMTGTSNGTVSFTYKCNGELAGVNYRDYGRIMYSLDGSTFTTITDGGGTPFRFQGVTTATTANISLPAAVNNTSFKLGWRWTNNANNGTNPPFVVDDIIVQVPATRIESSASQPGTENIFAGQDAYIKSTADGQILARIQNANVNLNCITATVSQAGNGTTGVTTTSGTYMRSNKVITLTASPANTTATYTATFYFSTAELAAWGSLTGLKLLKVTDGVNLASATINSSNGQLVAATIDDQRAAKGYASFTGNFTGGFSQFMIVAAATALPIELLSFEANGVGKKIVVNWSTSQEINNKGFAIERSRDGANFEKIGWVDGRINSDTRSDYMYNDNYVQPGVVYYYRLRQTDLDDKQKLSVVRQAKTDKGALTAVISPNPATDRLNLFISGSTSLASVRLLNMQGQTIRKWDRVNASMTTTPLNVNGLAKGLYMLEVELPEQKLVQQVMIK